MSAETYLSFQIGKLHFKDSMNFLNTSLDNSGDTVKNSKYVFPCLKTHCKYIKDDTDLDLVTKQGTFPYEYMNFVEKFSDTVLSICL